MRDSTVRRAEWWHSGGGKTSRRRRLHRSPASTVPKALARGADSWPSPIRAADFPQGRYPGCLLCCDRSCPCGRTCQWKAVLPRARLKRRGRMVGIGFGKGRWSFRWCQGGRPWMPPAPLGRRGHALARRQPSGLSRGKRSCDHSPWPCTNGSRRASRALPGIPRPGRRQRPPPQD